MTSRTNLQRTYTTNTFPSELDTEVVPSSLAPIAAILRVANEVEKKSPRVAYLCRFYAFENAHRKDPSSSGRGVRQFKTALLQRLEKDDEPSKQNRLEKTDPREMQRFYQQYYDDYLKDLKGEHQDRAALARAYQTAGILFDVLSSVTRQGGAEVDADVQNMNTEVKMRKDTIKHYNILPLDDVGASQAIMKLAEVRAAHDAIKNVRGLPRNKKNKTCTDILEWLQYMFGFQEDNVANQREHLVLLLANMHIALEPEPKPLSKLDQRAVDSVMKQMFKNYRTWCSFLGRNDKLELPEIQLEVQQRMILYMALYLLIWGEAANVRFMPECLCYIFHHMASEVAGMLSGNVSYITGENIKPAYGSDEEAFLRKVVTPIYNIIAKEKESNRNGEKPHSAWRNYDDLNEYFWSESCFRLGWPMRSDDEFFKGPDLKSETFHRRVFPAFPALPAFNQNTRPLKKTGFVEVRSFWHLFRSFDRMWTFYILWLQAMIIIAWNGSGSLGAVFDGGVFKKVLSIFITAAALRFFQALLDIIFNMKALQSLGYSGCLRLILKLLVAAFWIVILSTSYVHSWEHPTGLTRTFKNWLGHNGGPSVFLVCVILYLIPNAIAAIFFLLPFVRRVAEESDLMPVKILLWWSQPRCYVGRGMHEEAVHLISYTMFWLILLTCKLLFSYHVEIKPLVVPTKAILNFNQVKYAWHEFFPHAKGNIGVLIALWAPVILVYFMDTQIWYSVISTIWGGGIGAFMRLGEIRTLSMLRSRFRSLPTTFNLNLIPEEKSSRRRIQILKKFKPFTRDGEDKLQEARFAQLWNSVIETLRSEDLIDNEETGLMLLPYSANPYTSSHVVQWPPFLLASMAPMAIEMAKEYAEKEGNEVKDEVLWSKIEENEYMRCAVEECYEFLKDILNCVVVGETEKRLINRLIEAVEDCRSKGTLLKNFRMNELPLLNRYFVTFLVLLDEPNPSEREKVVFLLQDMLEVFMHDIMTDGARSNFESSHGTVKTPEDSSKTQYFAGPDAILYPMPENHASSEQVKRVLLLLTETESAMDVPKNLEARRRITFFTNSLFMEMPPAPRVRKMIPFSVLTPFYNEEVVFSKELIEEENEDGVSILFYLQNVYPDEWKTFLERLGKRTEEDVPHDDLRTWASFRGQTLSKTVRGMMYYKTALELQAFLDLAPESEILTGFKEASKRRYEEKGQDTFWAKLDAIVDMKFTYVAACQNYGEQKHSKDPKVASKAQDIKNLLAKYPSLRVAYVLEEEDVKIKPPQKYYYSVLVKAVGERDEEIYKIKLPGPVVVGEGKPENQNHALIFTRGQALQTIDMNQDNYLEEAFKMRNLLQEFKCKHGARPPSILGVREYIFTGSVSSLAWFMSNQESSFVTIGQRVLATPLKVRFHYGHPDVFDRLFHITRGGVSKASKGINLSEDIFAGFNSTLRRGLVTHHEYIQVGKGRDVGLNQISMFEAKVANGNGEQTLSRDIYRLGHRFDFFRMMSFYITTVGYYFSTMIVVLTVYVFLYGRLYLALSGLEKSLTTAATVTGDSVLQTALTSQSLVQLGLLMALPMVMEIGLERGFRQALTDLIVMQLQLASVFFTFSLGSRVQYYGRTILHGGAKYRGTGRGFVVFHEKFSENYRLYSRSHFVKGFELMMLLVIYNVYGSAQKNAISYVLITFSMWFLVGTWLFSPFLFNPSGFEWQKIVEDWNEWNKWIFSKGKVGIPANKSWESWWEEEQAHLRHTGFLGRLLEVILAFRFVLYQYGLVYHLNITRENKNLSIYGLSWVVIVLVLFMLKILSFGRKQFKANYQLAFRLLKGIIFVALVSVIVILFIFANLSVGDLFASVLAFMPTGWGLLMIFQACKPIVENYGMWDSVQALARTYEYIMGLSLFAPVAILAWFPFVSEFQTRLLFNQAFSRGLQISRILAGRRRRVADD